MAVRDLLGVALLLCGCSGGGGGRDAGSDAEGGGAPTISALADVTTDEDTRAGPFAFSVRDAETVEAELVVTASSSDEAILPADGIELGGAAGSRTVSLTPAENAFGGPVTVTLEVTDADGNRADTSFDLTVVSVNDPPTTSGLPTLTSYDDAEVLEVDLHAAFDDVEDGPEGLTYEIVRNSNPVLFDEVTVDPAAGVLRLTLSTSVVGHSEVVLRVTDRDGASLERETRGSLFPVYDDHSGETGVHEPDMAALGTSPLVRLTSFAFHDRVDGEYVRDVFAQDRLRDVLRTWVPRGTRLVLNIENQEIFGRDELGRDNLATAARIVAEERPDIELYGFYRLLPRRQWHEAVNWVRAQRDLDRGCPSTWWGGAEEYEANHLAWQAENALTREAPLSEAVGGGVLSDTVTAVFPSLYTFYRNWGREPDWIEVDLDPATDTLITSGREFPEGALIVLLPHVDGRLPTGLRRRNYERYVAVGVDGTRIQLAAEGTTEPLDFEDDGVGPYFAGSLPPWDDMWHDPSVLDWHIYAEQNIGEAERYGLPMFAYISPSLSGTGLEFIEGDFFHHQLEVLYPLVDGIVLYGGPSEEAAREENQQWWDALEAFMTWLRTVDGPATSFLVNVQHGWPPP